MIEIMKSDDSNWVILKVSGKLNTETVPELSEVLAGLSYEQMDLTFDFSELDYITSSGLRALLVVRKNLPADRVRMIHVGSEIQKIFDISGFSAYFTMETEERMPRDPSDRRLFDYRVRTSGDKKILYFCDRSYTWTDIDCCSQIIAADLDKLGVRKGTHVGLLSKNSANWLFTFFALQKLGAVAVLLNFSLNPTELIRYSKLGDITHLCFGDATSTVDAEDFVKAATSEDSKIIAAYDMRSSRDFTLRYDELPELSGKYSEMYESDDINMMIFTSGTTGNPKGVMHSSHNTLISSRIFADRTDLGEDDRNCLCLPLCHIFAYCACLEDMLLTNAAIVIPKDIADATLIDAIEKYQCTHLHAVPTKLISLSQSPYFDARRLSSLRCSAVGGAAISENQLIGLQQKMPNTRFVRIYGMSEVVPISMVAYDDTEAHIVRTNGRPSEHVTVEIRDPATKTALPAGKEGEITVRSDAALVSYYKLEPERQAIDENGWIPTGDLGMLDAEGYLYITGRIKELIIRGGENISPNEVAAVITGMEGISDVKVVGLPDSYFGEVVAAAIIMKQGFVFDKAALEKHIQSQIAKYKIPAFYVLFDSFPLLANGKVDMLGLKKLMAEQLGRSL